MRHLGETVDIHAGGEDLVFPHHENEIAQSEAATGKPFVKYWLHAKHLLVNGEKMSKSKGNFFTLRDLLAKGYDPMAVRYALISVHYRHQLNFTFDGLKEAREVIEKLDNCYFQCLSRSQLVEQKGEMGLDLKVLDAAIAEIEKALEDDLNMAVALAHFQEAVTFINANLSKMPQTGLEACIVFFRKMDKLFGLDITAVDAPPAQVRMALTKYMEARRAKDFTASDALRKEITELGWLVKDGRPGEPSTVKKARRAWDIKK
jgi:cysteinyl-tRNA synthetase